MSGPTKLPRPASAKPPRVFPCICPRQLDGAHHSTGHSKRAGMLVENVRCHLDECGRTWRRVVARSGPDPDQSEHRGCGVAVYERPTDYRGPVHAGGELCGRHVDRDHRRIMGARPRSE